MRRRVVPVLVAVGFVTAAEIARAAQAYGTGQQITVIPAATFRGETSADQFTAGIN